MKKLLTLVSLLVVASLALTACGGSGSSASDLLGAIQERGYIMVSSDPNYEPASFLNTSGTRPADTKCPEGALTTAEMQGFDVDVAKAIGDSLSVETCFPTPSWDAITAGNWADQWDVSVGSMTITVERQAVLDFSVPYYGTPAIVAVPTDSTAASLDDLAGQALCVGASTTYETWLNGGDLGPSIAVFSPAPAGITVVSLPTDQECAQALSRGEFAGYVTASTVVDSNIADGLEVKYLGDAVFTEVLAAAFDRSSSLDTTSLRTAVDELFTAMHGDGRLTALSEQWCETYLTQVSQ